jgi:predicted amidophosphoribosyltransferase
MRSTVELGDACAFCTTCGWGRRYMLPDASGVPETCPDCGGRVLVECPACGDPIRSLMALTCAGCGHELRGDELFGRPIRRKPERHAIAPQCAGEVERALADAE